MKLLISLFIFAFAVNAAAVEGADFKCQLAGQTIKSLPGLKKAPENYVVELKIKVITEQVPLYLINTELTSADGEVSEKALFLTDWTPKSNLSEEGEELLGLLSFFFGIDTSKVTELRAAMPTDLLDTFAYLELKDQSGNVTKLGFEGVNPEQCE